MLPALFAWIVAHGAILLEDVLGARGLIATE